MCPRPHAQVSKLFWSYCSPLKKIIYIYLAQPLTHPPAPPLLQIDFLFVFVCLSLAHTLWYVSIGAYSWRWVQGSLLVSSGEQVGAGGSRVGQPCARHVPCPPYCLSNPSKTTPSKERLKQPPLKASASWGLVLGETRAPSPPLATRPILGS